MPPDLDYPLRRRALTRPRHDDIACRIMHHIIPVLVPMLIGFFQVLTAAFAAAMLPGLAVLLQARRFGALLRWSVATVVIAALAILVIPWCLAVWKEYVSVEFFRSVPMYIGGGLNFFLLPFLLPEPFFRARRLLKKSGSDRRDSSRRRYKIN